MQNINVNVDEMLTNLPFQPDGSDYIKIAASKETAIFVFNYVRTLNFVFLISSTLPRLRLRKQRTHRP